MNEIAIRRLFITDKEWNRTSPSWKALKPLRNFSQLDKDDETAEECHLRLNRAGYQIPYLVVEQWIYEHYYNSNTVNDYGWIDYQKAHFFETTLPVDVLKQLYVIKEYRRYVESRSKNKPFDDFVCVPKDLAYWKTSGTWRTPPVLLDVASFLNPPSHAELGRNLQLIEGHTRLGYLLALENARMLYVREHKVFLLRAELFSN